MTSLLVFALLVLGFGLVSRLLGRRGITGPMVFVAAGLLVSPEALQIVDIDLEEEVAGEVVKILAELTLAIVLFTDAGRINFAAVRHRPQIPARLLAVAMPLSIALGLAIGAVVLTDLEFWEAAIVAAILAPTDAALGQAVITNREVPARVRQGLNVESGLNDGLAVPFLFIFIGLAGLSEERETASFWIRFVLEQIGLGMATGVAVGVAGALLLNKAVLHRTAGHTSEQLIALALALVSYLGAEHLGGNGFIAAFVAGLAGAKVCAALGDRLLEFNEEEGQLLTLATFFVFGVAFAAPRLDDFTWQILLYAILSLTVVRMVPVALSLAGLGLNPRTLMLALIVLANEDVSNADQIFTIAVLTVVLSVFAHGLTARRLAERFGRYWDERGAPGSPELMDVMPMAARRTSRSPE
jgi:NhaP-type Na+/H+ or K+/H+ antiporter